MQETFDEHISRNRGILIKNLKELNLNVKSTTRYSSCYGDNR